MNALFITHHSLSGFGGGSFASRAYINAFSEIFTELTVLYPLKKDDYANNINQKVNLIPVTYNIPKWKKFFRLCIGKVHRYEKIYNELLQKNHYDFIIFDNSIASFHLITKAHFYHSRVITIHHNYEYEYIKDSLTSIIKYIKLFWVTKYEAESIYYSDLNLTLTQQDKKLLSQHYQKHKSNIKVIGCFEYKKNDYENTNASQEQGNKFIITGNLSARQTINALLPWIKVYYPILKKKLTDVHLIIAGKHPNTELKEICHSLNIELFDTPKDMNNILNKGKYYICPISLGGGLKLRVMDGLSHGLPVITHNVSARGYDEFLNKYIFTYTDPKSFEIAIERISSLKFEKEQIIKDYKKSFSYQAGVDRLIRILEENFKINI
jgi:glycosyltransferase involved in cell wall biosynthesis